MWFITYLIIFLAGLIFSVFLTKIFCSLAVRINFIDKPSDRKFHKKPTPLMGGAGIFLGFWAVVFLCILIIKFFPSFLPSNLSPYAFGIWMRMPWVIYIFIGSFIVSAVGLWDDKFVLKPKQKLLFQFIVACLTVFAGIRIKLFLPDFLSYILSVVWILAITNAFNLLDNMDGASSGIALVCSFILFIVSLIMGSYFISALLAVFMGVLAGFLFFNFPPASIFMGDCGSLFIGYMMSIITILGTYYKPSNPTFFPVVIPLLVFAVPLFDIFSVMWIRMHQGKSIFHADKNHFSHRLVNMGMNVKTAVCFLYVLTFCAGLPSLILPMLSLSGVLVVFFQTVVIMILIALLEYYGKKAQ
jgi:UDP-GlcNAc:undecaprenyl-phosphate GlcNAc-1-phosphate transferase